MKFTTLQRQQLKELVLDCCTYRLSEKEALSYIRSRLGGGVGIGPTHYYRLKKQVESDSEVQNWLSHFSRVGFVLAHKQRMDEMDLCMRILLQMLFEKRAKMVKKQKKAELQGQDVDEEGEGDDVATILAIMNQIARFNKRLSNLSAGSPIISQLSAMLEQGGQNPPNIQGKEEYHQSNNNNDGSSSWLEQMTSTISDPQRRLEAQKVLTLAREEEQRLRRERAASKEEDPDDDQ